MFSWTFLFNFVDLNFCNKIQKQFSSFISKRQTLGIAAYMQANTSVVSPEHYMDQKLQAHFLPFLLFKNLMTMNLELLSS